MRPIQEETDKILYRIFKRHHSLLAEIIMKWPKIVGVQFSSCSYPLKLSFLYLPGKKMNTGKNQQRFLLYIVVADNATAISINYQQNLILERIAMYLGYKVIDKCKIIVK